MTDELGSAVLIPLVPAHSNKEPMEAAMPTHHVATGHWTSCMVSYIANPDVTEPPVAMEFTTFKNTKCTQIFQIFNFKTMLYLIVGI